MSSEILVHLSITNRHYNPVNIYWRRPDDDVLIENFHRTLKPGESYQQASYIGTTWIFRDLLTRIELSRHEATNDTQIRLWIDTSQRKQRSNGLPEIDTAHRPERDDNQFALMFDGENDIVIVPGEKLNFEDHFTLEAWIYRLSNGAEHPILDKTDGRQSGYFLRISADDRLQGGIRRGNTEVFFESSEKIEAMRWTHVAVSVDVVGYEIKGYINGSPATGELCQHLDRDYRSNVLDIFEGRFAFVNRLMHNRERIELLQNMTFEMWIRPVYDYDPKLNQQTQGTYPGGHAKHPAPFKTSLETVIHGEMAELEYDDGENPSPFGERVFTVGFGFYHADNLVRAQAELIVVAEAGELNIIFATGRRYTKVTNAINNNTWHHIALVCAEDSQPDSKKLKLFIDGYLAVEMIEQHIDLNMRNMMVGTTLLGNALHVNVASIRLWHEAKSPEELAKNWNKVLTGHESELIGYWSLNDGWFQKVGDSADGRPTQRLQDHSPNENHLIIPMGAFGVVSDAMQMRLKSEEKEEIVTLPVGRLVLPYDMRHITEFHLPRGGAVTLYDNEDFTGNSRSFTESSFKRAVDHIERQTMKDVASIVKLTPFADDKTYLKLEKRLVDDFTLEIRYQEEEYSKSGQILVSGDTWRIHWLGENKNERLAFTLAPQRPEFWWEMEHVIVPNHPDFKGVLWFEVYFEFREGRWATDANRGTLLTKYFPADVEGWSAGWIELAVYNNEIHLTRTYDIEHTVDIYDFVYQMPEPSNRPIHVLAVFNSDHNQLELYINGNRVQLEAQPQQYRAKLPVEYDSHKQTDLTVGLNVLDNPTNKSFDGRITDVRIWNDKPYNGDIKTGWNNNLTGKEKGLIGNIHITPDNVVDTTGRFQKARWVRPDSEDHQRRRVRSFAANDLFENAPETHTVFFPSVFPVVDGGSLRNGEPKTFTFHAASNAEQIRGIELDEQGNPINDFHFHPNDPHMVETYAGCVFRFYNFNDIAIGEYRIPTEPEKTEYTVAVPSSDWRNIVLMYGHQPNGNQDDRTVTMYVTVDGETVVHQHTFKGIGFDTEAEYLRTDEHLTFTQLRVWNEQRTQEQLTHFREQTFDDVSEYIAKQKGIDATSAMVSVVPHALVADLDETIQNDIWQPSIQYSDDVFLKLKERLIEDFTVEMWYRDDGKQKDNGILFSGDAWRVHWTGERNNRQLAFTLAQQKAQFWWENEYVIVPDTTASSTKMKDVMWFEVLFELKNGIWASSANEGMLLSKYFEVGVPGWAAGWVELAAYNNEFHFIRSYDLGDFLDIYDYVCKMPEGSSTSPIHIVAMFTSVHNHLRLYVNGEQQTLELHKDEIILNSIVENENHKRSDLVLGLNVRGNQSVIAFNGRINMVRIWNNLVQLDHIMRNKFKRLNNGDEPGLIANIHISLDKVEDRKGNFRGVCWVRPGGENETRKRREIRQEASDMVFKDLPESHTTFFPNPLYTADFRSLPNGQPKTFTFYADRQAEEIRVAELDEHGEEISDRDFLIYHSRPHTLETTTGRAFRFYGAKKQIIGEYRIPPKPEISAYTVTLPTQWRHIALTYGRQLSDMRNEESRSTRKIDHDPYEFVNNFSRAVTMFYLDEFGVEHEVQTLEPKKMFEYKAYVGQVWRFVDEKTGRTVAELTEPDQYGRYEINPTYDRTVIIYVKADGKGETAIHQHRFESMGFDPESDYLRIGNNVTFTALRVWDEPRALSDLDRFRYQNYETIRPGNHKLMLVHPSVYDKLDTINGAMYERQSELLLGGIYTPWHDTTSSFSLLPATLTTLDNDAPLRIGAALPNNKDRYFGASTATSFYGMIDAVRLWNNTRTAESIRQNWNQVLAEDTKGLRAYYQMDTGKGTTALDSTANAYHGEFGGANDIEDVRIWDVARTADEIRTAMYMTLDADDTTNLLVSWQLLGINAYPTENEVMATTAYKLAESFTIETRLNVKTLNIGHSQHAVVYRKNDWALSVVSDETELYAAFYYNYENRTSYVPWASIIAQKSPITSCEWVHLTVVGDRTAKTLTLYVDGVAHTVPFLIPSADKNIVPNFPSANKDNTAPIRVGGEGQPLWIKSDLILINGLKFAPNSRVQLPPMDAEFVAGMTLEMWVRTDGTGDIILQLGTDSSQRITLTAFGETETVQFTVEQNNISHTLTTREGTLSSIGWSHIAVTLIPSEITVCDLYINGEHVAHTEDFPTLSELLQKGFAGGVLMGQTAEAYADEVRFWRTARTYEQIASNARRTIPASHKALVANWSFDEGGGQAAYDRSMNGYHALLVGGDAQLQWMRLSENRNTGLYFDGNSYVTLDKDDPFKLSGSFTIELWLRIDALTVPWQSVLCKGDSAWHFMRQSDSDHLMFAMKGTTIQSGDGSSDRLMFPALEFEQWYHLAAVFDGKVLNLYVNGTVVVSGIVSGTMVTNACPVTLGDNADHQGRKFQGAMDELRFWNIARTAEQIATNMYAAVKPDTNGLIAYYPMNENFGYKITDKSKPEVNGIFGDGNNRDTFPTWTESSPIQFGGFDFNGNGDTVQIPHDPSLDLTTDFSLTAWIRPNLFNGVQGIITKSKDNFSAQYGLSIDGQQARFDAVIDGNPYTLTAGRLRAGWNHIAVVVRTNEVNLQDRYIEPTEANGTKVTVFSGKNFTGESKELGVVGLEDAGFTIESIRVPYGLTVSVFTGNTTFDPKTSIINNEGRQLDVVEDNPNLPNFTAEIVNTNTSTANLDKDAVSRVSGDGTQYTKLIVRAEQLHRERRVNQPKVQLYVNGLLVGSSVMSDQPESSMADVWIGAWGGEVLNRRYFAGLIDVVTVWGKSLRQDEIQTYMHQRLEPSSSALRALWRLEAEERTDITGITDESENNNQGMYRLHHDEMKSIEPSTPAYRLNGSLTLATNDLLGVAARYTIEIWVYANPTSSPSSDVTLLVLGTTDDTEAVRLILHPDLSVTHGWGENVIRGRRLSAGWHHIAGTYDGSTRALLIDGKKVASDTPSDNPTAQPTQITIGTAETSVLVGNIRIWKDALPDMTIARDSAYILAGTEPGLLHYIALSKVDDLRDRVTDVALANSGNAVYVEHGKLPVYPTSARPALRLKGSLALATDNLPEGDDAYTLEAWVYVDGTQSHPTDFALITYGPIIKEQTNRLYLRSSKQVLNTWFYNDLQEEPPLSGGWHHLAATYDGTTRLLLIDGRVVKRDMPGTRVNGDNHTLYLGADGHHGILADVRIWNVARDRRTIAADASRRLSGRESGLLHYFTFDDPTNLQDHITGVPLQNIENAEWLAGSGLPPYTVTTADLQMDGVILSAEAELSIDLKLGESYTIEMWVRPDTTALVAEDNMFMTLGDALQLAVQPDRRVVLHVSDGQTLVSRRQLTDDRWHHIAITCQSTDGKTSVQLYINSGVDVNIVVDHLLTINGSMTFGSKTYVGGLAQVRVWDHTRNRELIEQDMKHSLVGSEDGLLVNLTFDEQFGNDVLNHATDEIYSIYGEFMWEEDTGVSLAQPPAVLRLGSGSHLTSPHFDWLGTFTLEGWLRITANDSNNTDTITLNFGGRSYLPLQLDYQPVWLNDGNITTFDGEQMTDGVGDPNRSFAPNVWTHFALVQDSTRMTQSLYIYPENSEPIFWRVNYRTPSHPEGTNLRSSTLSHKAPMIWKVDEKDGVFLDLSEWRLWEGTRNSEELRATRYSRLTGGEKNLEAYWAFRELHGEPANDMTANDMHLARVGGEMIPMVELNLLQRKGNIQLPPDVISRARSFEKLLTERYGTVAPGDTADNTIISDAVEFEPLFEEPPPTTLPVNDVLPRKQLSTITVVPVENPDEGDSTDLNLFDGVDKSALFSLLLGTIKTHLTSDTAKATIDALDAYQKGETDAFNSATIETLNAALREVKLPLADQIKAGLDKLSDLLEQPTDMITVAVPQFTTDGALLLQIDVKVFGADATLNLTLTSDESYDVSIGIASIKLASVIEVVSFGAVNLPTYDLKDVTITVGKVIEDGTEDTIRSFALSANMEILEYNTTVSGRIERSTSGNSTYTLALTMDNSDANDLTLGDAFANMPTVAPTVSEPDTVTDSTEPTESVQFSALKMNNVTFTLERKRTIHIEDEESDNTEDNITASEDKESDNTEDNTTELEDEESDITQDNVTTSEDEDTQIVQREITLGLVCGAEVYGTAVTLTGAFSRTVTGNDAETSTDMTYSLLLASDEDASPLAFSRVVSGFPTVGKIDLNSIQLDTFSIGLDRESTSDVDGNASELTFSLDGVVSKDENSFALATTYTLAKTASNGLTQQSSEFSAELSYKGTLSLSEILEDIDGFYKIQPDVLSLTNPRVTIARTSDKRNKDTGSSITMTLTAKPDEDDETGGLTLLGKSLGLEGKYSRTKSSGGSTKSQYLLTLTLNESINFFDLVDEVIDTDGIGLDDFSLLANTEIKLIRGTNSKRDGATSVMMIDGSASIDDTAFDVDGKYTKASAKGATSYRLRLQKQEKIALSELLTDFGLDDNPFGNVSDLLPEATPYFEISNKTTQTKPKPKRRKKISKSTTKQQGG